MNYFLRDIDTQNDEEVSLIAYRTMETVLETIPEFEGRADYALKAFSNFTHGQMRAMIEKDFNNPAHRIIVAIDKSSGQVVGHSIFSIKVDDDSRKYGFCFSRYIQKSFRKKGIASQMLVLQEKWWREKGASYIVAHTHQSNIKLQKLFQKYGFQKEGPFQGSHFSYFKLEKSLL